MTASEEGIAEHFVEAGGLRIFYREVGEGTPLVLLHGGLATGEVMWSGEVLARLTRGHRVLVPDTRGHGRTRNPVGTLAYPQLADDVAAFCAALALDRPVLLGYSDGAQTALEAGLRHPRLARALVLGGVVTRPSEAYRSLLRGMGFTAPGEFDLEQVRAAMGGFFPTLRTAHEQARDPEGLNGFLARIAALWHGVPAYADEQLAGIDLPALVIVGDRDVPAFDESLRLHGLLPRGELAVIPGADHGAGERTLFWDAVMDFLSRMDG